MNNGFSLSFIILQFSGSSHLTQTMLSTESQHVTKNPLSMKDMDAMISTRIQLYKFSISSSVFTLHYLPTRLDMDYQTLEEPPHLQLFMMTPITFSTSSSIIYHS